MYVDARHDYSGALSDLSVWWDKLCPGGLFAGHDYSEAGVRRAVKAFRAQRGLDAAATRSAPADGSSPCSPNPSPDPNLHANIKPKHEPQWLIHPIYTPRARAWVELRNRMSTTATHGRD